MAEEIKIDRGDGTTEIIPLDTLDAWKSEITKFNDLRIERANQNPYVGALLQLVRGQVDQSLQELAKAIEPSAIQRNQAAAETSASAVFKSRSILNPKSEYGRQFTVAQKEDAVQGLFVRAAQINTIGIPLTLPSPAHNNLQGLDPRAVRAIVETYFIQEGIIGRTEAFDALLVASRTAISNADKSAKQASDEARAAKMQAAAAQVATREINAAFESENKRRNDLLDEWLNRQAKDQSIRDEHRQKQLDEWLGKQVAELGGYQDQQRKSNEAWIADRTKEIDAAKDALKASFATETAHTYWNVSKYKRHQRWALWTGIAGVLYLTIVAAGIGVLAWRLVAGPPRGFDQPLLQTPVSVVALFVLSGILVIWVGRLLARTYMAHVQLAEDAKERATMIETFIALIRAGAMKSEHVDALKAIFRPAASGLLAGDGSPETPVEVLMKQFGSKKD